VDGLRLEDAVEGMSFIKNDWIVVVLLLTVVAFRSTNVLRCVPEASKG